MELHSFFLHIFSGWPSKCNGNAVGCGRHAGSLLADRRGKNGFFLGESRFLGENLVRELVLNLEIEESGGGGRVALS